MNILFAVIRREYLQRVKSRWFLVSTFAAPLFFIGLTVVPILYETSRNETRRTMALVDQTGRLADRVQPMLEEAGFKVSVAPAGALDSLRALALSGDLGSYLVLDDEALSRGHVSYFGTQGPGGIRGMTIRGVVVQSAIEERLLQTGSDIDLDAFFAGGSMELNLLEEASDGTTEDEPEFVGVFAAAILLYMVVIMYAAAVMRAALEEKTGRIVEILISSVRPWELMLGKIIGVGSVGLTQLAVWILCGTVAFTLGIPALVAARPDLVDPEVVAQGLPGLGLMVLFVVLFLGGYFLYAALYAAVGAMCSSEEEAQQAQFPVIFLLVPSIILLMPVMETPNATWAVIASMFPFFTPVLLYARVGAGTVPLWQIGVSVALLYLGVLGVAWVAGRIYRVGILMQGKRPNLPELW
ncbi:MAG: ABC transporter permease, partial [Gemmatimonadetes bacterium]|nr:ABC transporter permease [Gemmatimonadota bacterium]